MTAFFVFCINPSRIKRSQSLVPPLCASGNKQTFVFLKGFVSVLSLMNSKRSGRPFPLLSSIFRAKNRWSARRRCFSGVPAQYLAQDFAKLQRVGSPARSADGRRDFLPAGGLLVPSFFLSLQTHLWKPCSWKHWDNALLLFRAPHMVHTRRLYRQKRIIHRRSALRRCICLSG